MAFGGQCEQHLVYVEVDILDPAKLRVPWRHVGENAGKLRAHYHQAGAAVLCEREKGSGIAGLVGLGLPVEGC